LFFALWKGVPEFAEGGVNGIVGLTLRESMDEEERSRV
jgi:hypothetical protein